MAWFVINETHVLFCDGTVLQDKHDILDGCGRLPDELEVVLAAGLNRYVLVAVDAKFFLILDTRQ